MGLFGSDVGLVYDITFYVAICLYVSAAHMIRLIPRYSDSMAPTLPANRNHLRPPHPDFPLPSQLSLSRISLGVAEDR